MASLNQCNFIGNLGADPEIRNIPSGAKVANFSIAVSEKWKDRNTGETKESTEWVRVVVWQEGLVKVVEQYLKKGSKVYVSGKMQTRKWQDQSGADKYSTEIVLQGFTGSIIMLDGRNNSDGVGQRQDNSGGGQQQQRPQQQRPIDNGMEDDIPFN